MTTKYVKLNQEFLWVGMGDMQQNSLKKRQLLTLCLGLVLSSVFCSPLWAQGHSDAVFPEGFMWGSATAAYQVEGGIRNDWTVAGVDAGEAVGHWQDYKKDFDALQAMGHTLYRMSLSWARIEPQPGQFDEAALQHYRKMLQALKQRHIRPMVTLFHFTAPQWFAEKGGWTRAENIADFERFVSRVSAYFAEDVYYWNTVNEPLVYAFRSYDEGAWPPFQKNREQALTVAKNLVVAHGKAYRIIHRQDPLASVGFAKHISVLAPHWPLNPADQAMTALQSYLFNDLFWQALKTGEMNLRIPGYRPIEIPYDPLLQNTVDYLGVNFYSRYYIEASGKNIVPPEAPKTELNWAISPEGFKTALQRATPYARHFRVPIIVTENGLADHDDNVRPGFLVHHLKAMHEAIAEGAPVAGYLHWSAIDNFEWTDGYKPQFGLMTRERVWRPSAYLYQEVIQKNALPFHWLAKYPLQGEKTPLVTE